MQRGILLLGTLLVGGMWLVGSALAQGRVDCEDVRKTRLSRLESNDCRESCDLCPDLLELVVLELDLTIKCDESCEKTGQCEKKEERCAFKELADAKVTPVCLDPADECDSAVGAPAWCAMTLATANCRCVCKDQKTADDEQRKRRERLKELTRKDK